MSKVEKDNKVDDDGDEEVETKLSKREMKKMLKEAKDKTSSTSGSKKKAESGGNAPWLPERECLLLLLKSRMLLREMIELRVKQDRIAAGELSIGEIQKLLEGQQEENELDFISEIQELKAQLVNDIRRNHSLEADLKKLDKRIALLIKNRGNLQMVLAAQQGLKSQKKKKQVTAGETETIISDHKKLEQYQNLFYLLQTEPQYLAKLVFLMKTKEMDNFLETVLLTLYGDAFSPREEYLILELFRYSLNNEMKNVKNVRDFLKADSVVPQMVSTYNRRKQGVQYLQGVLGKLLNNIIADDFDLELKPQLVYNKMVGDFEVSSGEKWPEAKLTDEAQIMERDDVQKLIKGRVKRLIAICDVFFNEIVNSLAKLPYGIRWICRLLHDLAEENFPDANEDDMLKIISYFVYYRFFNLAIITPDVYDIVDRELPQLARKNLVAVAKTLQNLFNLILFDVKKASWMAPLNTWIKDKIDAVRDYFEELIDVEAPDDALQLDKYMELTQKTKPLIVISLHEIAETHRHLAEHLTKLAPEKDDPLRIILADLGDAPLATGTDDDDREVQLVLTNRFAEKMEAEISQATSLYVETKELVISALRVIPITDGDDINLLSILKAGKKHAKLKSNTALETQIAKILDNLKQLEGSGSVTKDDNYAEFLREIALEVANRAAVREQQKKEIKRLTTTRQNLKEHQDYLNTQLTQYENYLQDCRAKQAPSGKGKKSKKMFDKEGHLIEESKAMGPFKFSHSKLTDMGVLVESEVPQPMRKKTEFLISSEQPGEYKVVCNILGKEAATETLELDTLLELHENGGKRIELDKAVLDVPMTIHLLNKYFLLAKK